MSNSLSTLTENSADVITFSQWLDIFDSQTEVTGDQLDEFCAGVPNSQFALTVLSLGRTGKLQPTVLADSTYMAWLKSSNPKRDMASSNWTELFRLAYAAMPDHELFEVPDPA